MSSSYWLLKSTQSIGIKPLYVQGLKAITEPSAHRGKGFLEWTSRPRFALRFIHRRAAESLLNIAIGMEAINADLGWIATEHAGAKQKEIK